MVWLAPFKTFELKDVLVEGRFEMCTGLLRAPESALVTVRNGEEDDIVQLRVPELAQLHTSLNARQHEGQWHGEGVNAGIYNSRLSRHATKGKLTHLWHGKMPERRTSGKEPRAIAHWRHTVVFQTC